MNAEEIVNELRRHGLSNGTALGTHVGICDIAADLIESLTAELTKSQRREKATATALDEQIQRAGHLIAVLATQRDESQRREKAAVAQIQRSCSNCAYWRPKEKHSCVAPGNTPCGIKHREAWQWRGPQEDEKEAANADS